MQKRKASRKKRKYLNLIQQAKTPDEQREALLVSIKTAAHMLSRCETAIYELMRAGKLKAVKSGRRTLITVPSIHEYVESLPVRGDGEWMRRKAEAEARHSA
jgi:excisionase family DNA binding protein